MLKTTLELASSLLFPKICQTCDKLLPAEDTRGICEHCAGLILKISAPFCSACGRTVKHAGALCGQCHNTHFHFDRACAATYYEGKMQELLQTFKFDGRKSLLPFFCELLMGFILKYLPVSEIDLVVSVPMETKKINERGFNQASLLSKTVAQKINKVDQSRFFKRKKMGGTQSLLGKNQRAKNIQGSFVVLNAQIFESKNVLLIDDILTTGFTASECAKILKEAGAKNVTVLAVARGL